MVKIVGASGTVIDIPKARAENLVRSRVAKYVDKSPEEPPKTEIVADPPAEGQDLAAVSEEDLLEGLPAKNAKRDDWAEAALAEGIEEDQLTGKTREELIELIQEVRAKKKTK